MNGGWSISPGEVSALLLFDGPITEERRDRIRELVLSGQVSTATLAAEGVRLVPVNGPVIAIPKP